MYGGTPIWTGSCPCQPGLSPCVRGNPCAPAPPRGRAGTIPVCTGEPQDGSTQADPRPDYPRVYGGTLGVRSASLTMPGLSPCVRGNPPVAHPLSATVGTIPVCTGEPTARPTARGWTTDYPRVYGGTLALGIRKAAQAGLSPCVRGNLTEQHVQVEPPGTIPVCTGEPSAASGARLPRRDYPRVYGGTRRRLRRRPDTCGLSPCVRGNQAGDGRCRDVQRTIPVCTGEPAAGTEADQRHPDYPRVYGGTPGLVAGVVQCHGLSPCVRGNQRPELGGRVAAGTIPVCTGEPAQATGFRPTVPDYPRVYGGTGPCRTGRPQVGDYPRVYGGTMLGFLVWAGLCGLSPCVRGNRHRVAERIPVVGTIPVCTGEPGIGQRSTEPVGDYPRVYGGTGHRAAVDRARGGLSPCVRGNRA